MKKIIGIIIIVLALGIFLYPKTVILFAGIGGPYTTREYTCIGIRKDVDHHDASISTCYGIVSNLKCFYTDFTTKDTPVSCTK
jgi:hypothetical protein